MMQFKWRPPVEPGGPAVTSYRFQISPPPAVEDDLLLDEVSFSSALGCSQAD